MSISTTLPPAMVKPSTENGLPPEIPEAFQAIQALGAAAGKGGVPAKTLGLIELRASQINGCSLCVDLHARVLKKQGETDERLFAVAAWRDAPYFTDAERAALALAEAVTRLAGPPDPVPDHVWDQAAAHYDERGMASLLLGIVTINVYNRLNIATRQQARIDELEEIVRRVVAGSAKAWE